MSGSGVGGNAATGAGAPRRVAVLGAESTGKSTLAAALAERHRTLWVPEYLREFVETMGRTPREQEQVRIAFTQAKREDAAAGRADRLLFCDTTPLMTALYSRHYWGRVDPRIEQLARTRAYAVTLVTAPDTPWEPDGLQRESEAVRQRIHREVVAALDGLGVAWVLVTGSLAERLAQVDAVL
ncbi:MAG TPA: ATP-binding protein [Noviherbaspirillum sp.]|jgi:NadR type nicotinamide-nucleotide adenylyltransferase|uniref:ATP-binding protein n=1 Tax=Noviherbaspirillum sp. TaxID=1926288 RepID=UPI002F9383B4